MLQFVGALQQGFVYALLALGIYITFRILNTPDLTADGSFTLGMAVSAVLSLMGHPLLGLFAAALAGAAAGCVTGLLQTKAGVYPILAGILTMSGLYSINMLVMGGTPNLAINQTLFKDAYALFPALAKDGRNLVALLLAFLVCALVCAKLIWLFKTHLGLCIRAVGDNEEMVRSSSINASRVKVLALMLSNACVALSGAMSAQLQGFADVNAGVGMVVVGIASVIIGEAAVGKRGVTVGLLSAVLGSILYRFIYALAFRSNFFPAYMLKLVSAVIVGAALSLPVIKKHLRRARLQKGGSAHA
ncbi:MAG: ABC transporter permease [Clostridia bacterium]